MFFVRSASPGDLEKVRELLATTWRETYVPLYGGEKVEEIIAESHSPAALKERLVRPHSEFVVADDGKLIGGMAYAAMSRELTKTVVLHQLYVHPDHQGHGIGRDLFSEIETCFPDAEILRLEVDENNTQALAFYKAHGLIEVDRTENCGENQSGIPALILEKRLEF